MSQPRASWRRRASSSSQEREVRASEAAAAVIIGVMSPRIASKWAGCWLSVSWAAVAMAWSKAGPVLASGVAVVAGSGGRGGP